jgi:hypothetical protein
MAMRRSVRFDIVYFIALLATALAMAAAMAHALELPNKLRFSRDEYFVVQQTYRGWNQLGYLLAVQFAAMVVAAFTARHEPRLLWPTIIAIAGLISAQAVFWVFTYPTNVATDNWTSIPDNWEQLRNTWEYSHAAGAALQVVSMAALIFGALARRQSTIA